MDSHRYPASPYRNDPRAAFFDERAANWEAACYPDQVRARLAPMSRDLGLPQGGRVLDMGCGPGTLTPYLLRAVGPTGLVAAFDLSEAMARLAARKFATPGPGAGQAGPPRRGGALQATAMELPFPDGTFDALVCFAAFPHFADKPRAMAEMARVARPSAPLFVVHLLGRAELLAHHKTHPAVADDALPDEAAMRELFRSAGFAAPRIVDRPDFYLATAAKTATPRRAP